MRLPCGGGSFVPDVRLNESLIMVAVLDPETGEPTFVGQDKLRAYLSRFEGEARRDAMRSLGLDPDYRPNRYVQVPREDA